MSKVVVTGAASGIGLELCRHYLGQGREVVAVCRRASEPLEQLGVTVISGIDVMRAEDIAQVRARLAGQSVALLINNAGVFGNHTLGSIDYDDVRQQLEVNAIAPLRLTEALLPNLAQGAKVALITSRMGSMGDNSSGSYYGYRMSKAALNAAGVSLARDLQPRGVAVAILHPGFVQTKMVGYAGDITPAVAAQRLAARIDALTLANTGSFWHSNGELLPW